MVRKFDRISIEFSIEFFARKFYRIFLAGWRQAIIANRRAVCNGRIYKLKTYIYSITSIASTYKDSVMLSYEINYAVLHANSYII